MNRIKTNNRVPRIGMRIIKSAIGVLVCFLVDLLRGNAGLVFYSQLAVLWCIRDYISETKQFAIQRTIGTAVGALYGLGVLLLHGLVGDRIGKIEYSIAISAVIVLVLYTTVVLKQKQASYFSCVVFLSIVINHVGDLNPYVFVWNRFLDTMIGIIVGLVINCMSMYKKHDTNVLFLSGLDDTLLAPGGEMSDYSRVELNRMIEKGAKFTVSTVRTPASLMEPLRGVNLKLPVIAMDGAALFNLAENCYERVYTIAPEHCSEVRAYLEERGINYFSNVVIEDVLLIYYQDSENEKYNELVRTLRKSPYRNYVKRPVPEAEHVVYFMLMDSTEHIESIYQDMKKNPVFENLKVIRYEADTFEDCSMVKVFNKNASKENMLDYLKAKIGVQETVSFGTIEGKYTHVINAGDFNKVVNLIKKQF